jgi:hypothetical protein
LLTVNGGHAFGRLVSSMDTLETIVAALAAEVNSGNLEALPQRPNWQR